MAQLQPAKMQAMSSLLKSAMPVIQQLHGYPLALIIQRLWVTVLLVMMV
jgi:hypothetical protein